MHGFGRVIRCGSTLRVGSHISGEHRAAFLSGKLRSKDRSTTGERFLCSSKSNEDGDGASNKDGKTNKSTESINVSEMKTGSKSNEAKAKLNSLLKSIVKEAAEKKTQEGAVNMRLAIPIKEKETTSLPEESKTEEEIDAEKELGKEMVQAVKQVAEAIEGEPQEVESELVQKLKTQVGKKVNLSDLFAGMKIDRSAKASTTPSQVDIELSRAHHVRRLLDTRAKGPSPRTRDEQGSGAPEHKPRQRRSPESYPPASYVPIDLFGAPPLGIFYPVEPKGTTTETPKLKTWDALLARDLKLSVTHPPANGFEEMIAWTEQGKLWKFPIDNEQGLDEEAKVPFHEHVFLEPQLESWCPKRGPIRHFMELVCAGLSKNPFITVKEKHEQIEWYHKYFLEKAAIVKEVGAGEIK